MRLSKLATFLYLSIVFATLAVGSTPCFAAQFTVPQYTAANAGAPAPPGFIFDSQCSAAAVSCTATASISGDLAVVWCHSSYFTSYAMSVTTSPSLTMTASPSGSTDFDGSFDMHTEAFYALSLPSGSTAFTCAGTGTSNNPAILVLLFQAPSTAAFDTSLKTLESSATTSFSTATFNTSARGIVVQFVTGNGGNVSAGSIGVFAATLGATASNGPNSSEYKAFSGAQSNISASFTDDNPVGWEGATLAFKY